MPEGHTIHRLARFHRHKLAGQRLTVSSPQGRFTDAPAVDGHVLADVRGVGKHLFYVFDPDLTVHVHLGMRGSYRLATHEPSEAPAEPRGAVRMRLVGDRNVVDLSGPTACEVLDPSGVRKLLDRLGPDVLDPHADAEKAWAKISRSVTPIGVLLMDQSVISGIGNAYRAEILYRQRVHPLLPGKKLKREQFDRLWADSVHLLKIGVKYGHILCVDAAEIGKPLSKAGRKDRFHVYRNEFCRGCGAKVKMLEMAGRDCFFCPKEQKTPRGTGAKAQAAVVVKKRRRSGEHG